MIITFQKENIDFWKDRGFEPVERFKTCGYTYWNIDVPADHDDLKNPEYITLALKEQREFPDMIRKRFEAPMYAVVIDGRVAMTPVKSADGQETPMAMPISRDVSILRGVFTKPERKQVPRYVKLKRTNQIVNAMREVRQFGVRVVADFIKSDIVETFSLDRIAIILAPRVELYRELPGKLTQGNKVV